MMRQITFTLFLIFSCSLWAQSNPLKLTMKEAEELFRTHNLLLVAEYYNVDMAQAQVVQAKLFDNPIITLEQNIYNRLNGKYFDLGKEGESGVQIEQAIWPDNATNEYVWKRLITNPLYCNLRK